MVVSDGSQKVKPPYVSFKTFLLFLEDMKHGTPDRVDKRFLEDSGKSGSTCTQLLAALRFFALIDADGTTTDQLRAFKNADVPRQKYLLHQMGIQCYDFVFSSIDVKNANYGQLSAIFQRRFELADDVTRKCAKFFRSLASFAGIDLSERINKKKIHTTVSSKNANNSKNAKTSPPPEKQNLEIPKIVPTSPVSGSWPQVCLEATFPRFELEWTPEQRSRWFVAFNELIRMNPDDFGMRNHHDG